MTRRRKTGKKISYYFYFDTYSRNQNQNIRKNIYTKERILFNASTIISPTSSCLKGAYLKRECWLYLTNQLARSIFMAKYKMKQKNNSKLNIYQQQESETYFWILIIIIRAIEDACWCLFSANRFRQTSDILRIMYFILPIPLLSKKIPISSNTRNWKATWLLMQCWQRPYLFKYHFVEGMAFVKEISFLWRTDIKEKQNRGFKFTRGMRIKYFDAWF